MRARLEAAHPAARFVGVQRGDALAAHYASADAFLFPSLSDTFGNVDARSARFGPAGRRVDVAAAAEHVVDGRSGSLVAAGDAAGFVAAVGRIVAEPARLAPMRAAALDAARRAHGPRCWRASRRICKPSLTPTPGCPHVASLPEAQLAWVERERLVARWMHRASTRRWVVPVPHAVSRVGDGWLWYASSSRCRGPTSPTGTSCVGADVRLRPRRSRPLQDHQALDRTAATVTRVPRIRACARSLDEYSFPSGHTLHSVAFSVIITRLLPASPSSSAVHPLLAVSRVILALHYPSDVVVGAADRRADRRVSFNLL